MRAFDGEPERGVQVHRVRVSDYAQQPGGAAGAGGHGRTGKLTLRVAETFRPRPRAPRSRSCAPAACAADWSSSSERLAARSKRSSWTAATRQRTGREFQFEYETRQATIDALAGKLGRSTSTRPRRPDAQPGLDRRHALVDRRCQNATVAESASLRRGGAKHKQVR